MIHVLVIFLYVINFVFLKNVFLCFYLFLLFVLFLSIQTINLINILIFPMLHSVLNLSTVMLSHNNNRMGDMLIINNKFTQLKR
jgi:hypothetical protein